MEVSQSHRVRMTSKNHLYNICQSTWTCIMLVMQLSYRKTWPIKLRKACKLLPKEMYIFYLASIIQTLIAMCVKTCILISSCSTSWYSPNLSESLNICKTHSRKKYPALKHQRRHFPGCSFYIRDAVILKPLVCFVFVFPLDCTLFLKFYIGQSSAHQLFVKQVFLPLKKCLY